MARKSKIKVLIYALLALFLLVVTVISGRVTLSAFADTSAYTSALEDLQKDSNFKLSDYPDKKNSYAISVIQIAESTAGELFVYTYQPCQKTKYLVATEINMALTDKLGGEVSNKDDNQSAGGILGGVIGGIPGTEDSTKLYGLTLINSSGVFCKYKVNDFTVSSDKIRYYNITSIYREWIKGIDKETGNDNTKNAVAFPVGKCYKAITENGVVKYECKETETIDIIDQWHDFLRYREGTSFFTRDYIDSHYVAFSTDRDIDRLIEAKVSFVTRSCVETTSKNNPFAPDYKIEYGDPLPPVEMIISDTDMGHSTYHNFWYEEKRDGTTWKRIQTVKEFTSSEVLEDDTKNKLKGKQWVLRFFETDYKKDWQAVQRIYSTNVSEITILRLTFEKDGKIYNLGAVSDKVTGDNIPGNPQDEEESFWEYVWNCIVKLFNGTATLVEQIVAVVAIFIALLFIPAIMLILSIFFPVVRTVLKTVFNGICIAIKYLFIGLWYVISSPVRLIIWIVRKCRGE